jgi:hypothetical protein
MSYEQYGNLVCEWGFGASKYFFDSRHSMLAVDSEQRLFARKSEDSHRFLDLRLFVVGQHVPRIRDM